MNKLLPFKNRVIVKKIHSTSINGIDVPVSNDENALTFGEIVAVSDESEAFFTPGDKVYFTKYGFNKVNSLDENLGIVSIEDILGYIRSI